VPAPIPEQPAAPPAIVPSSSEAIPPSGPPIRIGLETTAIQVRISAPGEFYLVEKIPEAPRQTVRGEVEIRLERNGRAGEVYRIQVASLSRSEAAEDLRRTLAERLGIVAVVRDNPATGTKQVRVGEFSTREEALAFLRDEVRQEGFADAIVVRDTSTVTTGDPTLALRGPDNLFRVSRNGYIFIPGTNDGFLRLAGRPFRGIFDVSLNSNGAITVVNQLALEEYLFGVVPAEISPTQYPEFNALAAQSIAARTYALKHMGRFNVQGFDLTADTRSQVYGGAGFEKPATNDAVRKTAGLAIYYGDSLIDAMYSSTCGGRTEDFGNVFDTRDVPYLKSVACAVENEVARDTVLQLTGTRSLDQVLFADDGAIANRSLELAAVLGIAGSTLPSPESLSAAATRDDVWEWTERAAGLAANRTAAAARRSDDRDVSSRAGFLRYAAERVFGLGEIARQTTDGDTDYYIGNLKDGAELPQNSRRAVAYLIETKLWHAYPDNTARPSEPIRRSDALCWLARWVEHLRPELFRSALLANLGNGGDPGNRISVKSGSKNYEIPLAGDVRLFKVVDGRSTAVVTMNVVGNERLRYHLNGAGAIDFLEVELNSTGTASDRFSPMATWETTLMRTAIGEKVKSLAGSVGEFRDLRPVKLGSSGRAVRLEIIGSRGSAVVNGYRLRNALGLRDTLFTISREVSASGSIERFTFRGRGWGHGVGLCQVGAYGMARAGRSFEEILKTYYQGVELRKAY
jgi:stage II sporulation protein D